MYKPFRRIASTIFSLLAIIVLMLPASASANSPSFTGYQHNAESITAGPDGAMWFTDPVDNSIGRIASDGTITDYALPTPHAGPYGIAAGPDGALWFIEAYINEIGRITTSGNITEYPAYGIISGPSIVAGPDGAMWFIENAGSVNSINAIERISLSGNVTQYPIPSGAPARQITAGPDGALWFSESANTIGRITTDGTITEYPSPGPSSGITSGPDGAIWFTSFENDSSGNDWLGRMTTSGQLTEYSVPRNCDGEPNLGQITSGPNNSLFFLEQNCQAVDRINTDGSSLTSYPIPLAPKRMALGADGTIWVTNGSTPIGRIDPGTPTLGTPSWTVNPVTTTQSTTVSIPVSDTLFGVARGEYYIGTTDPGQGNGTPMTVSSGSLSTNFTPGSLAPGNYQINFRAEDDFGNWSPVTTDFLVVINTSNGGVSGHSNNILPVYGSDVLPYLTQTGQTDTASFGLRVRYSNGALDSSSSVKFDYNTGTKCKSPGGSNCHTTSLSSTSIDWLVVGGINNSQATIQGTANLTIDGVTTSNPFRAVVTQGSLVSQTTPNTFQLEVYAPGANPNTAQPLYTINEPLGNGGNVTIN